MANRHVAFQAIGTRWSIKVDDKVDNKAWMELLDRIQLRIESFDKAYSRFRSDSLVTKMSEKSGTYDLPPDGFTLLKFYERLYRATDGKVTPLIGQVVSDAGYDANYSFKSKTLRQPPRWEDVLTFNEHEINVSQPALLDFGAAGKGYLVDLVCELMMQAGIRDYLINAGGDILHRSVEKVGIDVGLENPFDTSEAIGVARLNNQSLCASAGGKRTWGEFHHIIDPSDLRSPENIAASWVIAADTMQADGIATALFFAPADALQKKFDFSFTLLDHDMNLYYSKEFPITTFTLSK